jgi:hypothetical protein
MTANDRTPAQLLTELADKIAEVRDRFADLRDGAAPGNKAAYRFCGKELDKALAACEKAEQRLHRKD